MTNKLSILFLFGWKNMFLMQIKLKHMYKKISIIMKF